MAVQESITHFPPGPSGFDATRNIWAHLKGISLDHYETMWRLFGEIAYAKMGPLHTYYLFDPELIHHVLVKNQKNYIKGDIAYEGFRLVVGYGLVTSDGNLWRKQRRLMQPPFTVTAVNDFLEMMNLSVEQMLVRWEQLSRTGEPVDMGDEMMRLTTSVIGQALFDVDLSLELTDVGYAFQDVFTFVPQRTMSPVKLPLSWPLPKHRAFQQNMLLIDEFVADQVRQKRAMGLDKSLVSKLIEARDKETGYTMSEQQLRDEIVTLFFAGFETTARSLTWLYYLMSRHPEIAERVAAEAEQVLNGRAPTVEDLYQLQYTRMVVDEVLRVYPPVAVMPRQNVEEDEIGGYPIPAGSMTMSMTFIAHNHPQYWDHPERFDPDRFAPEIANERPKYAYIPFANGQRICLGNSFALLEMVVATAMSLARFRFRPVTDEPVGTKYIGIIAPDRPIHLYLDPR